MISTYAMQSVMCHLQDQCNECVECNQSVGNLSSVFCFFKQFLDEALVANTTIFGAEF